MTVPSEIPLGAPEESRDFAIDPPYQDSKENDKSPIKMMALPEPGSLASADILSMDSLEISQSTSNHSTHVDFVKNARRPQYPHPNSSLSTSSSAGGGVLPESLKAKMQAFQDSRQSHQPHPLIQMSPSPGSPHSNASKFRTPDCIGFPAGLRPSPVNTISAPVIPKMPTKPSNLQRRFINIVGGLPAALENPLAQRRGIKFDGGHLGSSESLITGPKTANDINDQSRGQYPQSMFNQFSEYIDTKNGTLNFAGKAVVRSDGIDFTSGHNFRISLDEVDTLEELGKGNYGTVYKVRHARPKMRRPGLGLAGFKLPCQSSATSSNEKDTLSPESYHRADGSLTGVVMAMKEIRLELDEAKFAAIIMELDILHRCNSPYIIDFYGAFFQEGAVYICIEFMDGGSVDKLYGNGIPEDILRKITYSTIQGLKTLKEDHKIIHRDVKPTNILVNTRGQVKICDFGVSGNLVASIAKTKIGCQSYMAPERISGGDMAHSDSGASGTYSVQSDIWSLGLSIIECAMGRYPYPPETYNSIFSQISAIVEGEPPDLPKDRFSPQICDFVRSCLQKKPKLRPSYSKLLQHPWFTPLSIPHTISELDENNEVNNELDDNVGVITDNKRIEDKEVAEWVKSALERKKNGSLVESLKPALHTAQPHIPPHDSHSPTKPT